eukprot:COSAG02_NODE_19407_length_883_cov_1.369898_1_plen_85_part_00
MQHAAPLLAPSESSAAVRPSRARSRVLLLLRLGKEYGYAASIHVRTVQYPLRRGHAHGGGGASAARRLVQLRTGEQHNHLPNPV